MGRWEGEGERKKGRSGEDGKGGDRNFENKEGILRRKKWKREGSEKWKE